MIKNQISNNLVDYIFYIIGLDDVSNLNTAGMVRPEFKTTKTIKIDHEDFGVKEFSIYSAVTKIENSSLNVVAVPIIYNTKDYEFILVFQLDDNCIYGLKKNSNGEYLFLTSKGQVWNNISFYDKLLACAGFEYLNDHGIIWKIEDEYEKLYKSLIQIVEM